MNLRARVTRLEGSIHEVSDLDHISDEELDDRINRLLIPLGLGPVESMSEKDRGSLLKNLYSEIHGDGSE